MSKPLWSDSPSWARYLAQDDDGGWFWFQNKPTYGQFGWMINGGRYLRARPTDCRATLEEKPVHNEAEEGK
jgi:hypothetical protein